MTFERTGTGTGVDNSIPKIREQEGKGKKHSQNSGTRKGMKIAFPKFRHVKGTKKLIPNSGRGIRGFLFGEWMGTGISAHP